MYIVDFICHEKMLIIEIDGGQHNEPQNIKSDALRSQFLNDKGYKIIRFWNNDVRNNIEGVHLKLFDYIFKD